MSSVLHIKDSYYFEIPKALAPAHYAGKADFPEVWVRLDDDYQRWEADRLAPKLAESLQGLKVGEVPSAGEIKEKWLHAKEHDHVHFARPLASFLEFQAKEIDTKFKAWVKLDANKEKGLTEYCAAEKPEYGWFAQYYYDVNKSSATKNWAEIKQESTDLAAYKKDTTREWSQEKVAAYNKELSGKFIIPQVFGGQLRNLYERESGICVSKYMVIELLVAIIMVALFSWLAGKIRNGAAPKGRLANMLETVLLYFRDNVVRPAIGGHDDHGHDDVPENHGHDADISHADHGHGHGGKAHAATIHGNPADAYLPLIWTLFSFVLLCNLAGMVPWVGAPTAAFGVTTGLALVTLATVFVMGMREFGFFGFLYNQIPSMDLPLVLAIPIKGMLFLIEMAGLLIKHGVLAIRLLANMVAGHLVILGIMGIAFSIETAASSSWPVAAGISVLAATAFNLLELLVAFLQAYLFVFLSSLFIGAAIHKH